MNTRRSQEDIQTVENIAEEFAKQLKAEVGNANMRHIVAKNYQVDYRGCCASHDYCDSNMVMADAFEEITGREPDDNSETHPEDWSMFNEAWEIAKIQDFYFDPRA